MRTLASLALAASLLLVASSSDARPRKSPRRPADSAWVKTCIHERTGPVGGISVREARAICLAEQPDDEVSAAKAQLSLARANAKVLKAKERVRKAVEACEQAIVDRCVDIAKPDGSTDCMDSALWGEFVSICGEQGPRPEGGN